MRSDDRLAKRDALAIGSVMALHIAFLAVILWGLRLPDAAIEAFAKAHWRFQPAKLDGKPIQYATTAAVPVGQSG